MNWGQKLMLAMGLFMAFIVFLSFRMIFSNEDELIDKNYYEEGLNYDKDYNAQKQALTDSLLPEFKQENEQVAIRFPVKVNYTIIAKCLAKSKNDKIFKGSTSPALPVNIKEKALSKGEWLLTIVYQANGKNYQTKQNIIIP